MPCYILLLSFTEKVSKVHAVTVTFNELSHDLNFDLRSIEILVGWLYDLI